MAIFGFFIAQLCNIRGPRGFSNELVLEEMKLDALEVRGMEEKALNM